MNLIIPKAPKPQEAVINIRREHPQFELAELLSRVPLNQTTISLLGGSTFMRHKNGSGFVEKSVQIAEGAYVDKTSVIFGQTDRSNFTRIGCVNIGPNVVILPGVVMLEGVKVEGQANIFENATLDAGVQIGEGTIIESAVQIGSNTKLGEFVVLHQDTGVGHDVEIGNRVKIGTGSIIGSGAKLGDGIELEPYTVVFPNQILPEGAEL